MVAHSLLLKQLGLYKCSEEFTKSMKSQLSQRTQVISINGKTFSASEVTCAETYGDVTLVRSM